MFEHTMCSSIKLQENTRKVRERPYVNEVKCQHGRWRRLRSLVRFLVHTSV